jgi:hypothetical protein
MERRTASTPFVAVQQAAWRALNPRPTPSPRGDTDLVENIL